MSFSTTRVLVLEADSQLRDDLAAALSGESYEVRATENGNDLEGFDADVLVVDLRDRSVGSVLTRLGVRAVVDHAEAAAARGMELYGIWIDPHTHQATRDGRPLLLTATEFALLVALVRRGGAVASKAELLRELRGTGSSNPNLIEAHVSSLRRKLDATGSPLIHTVRGVGYNLCRADLS